MPDGASAYEQWVVALRRWAVDPLTDLSHLPALDEATLPPAAFQRLLKHLNAAINDFMRRWRDSFLGSLRGASRTTELARILIDARAALRPRLQLAEHPSLAVSIRAQLRDQAHADVRRIQEELEGTAQRTVGSVTGSARREREELLRIYRDNSLVALLHPAQHGEIVVDHEVRRAEAQELRDDADLGWTGIESSVRRPRRVIITGSEN